MHGNQSPLGNPRRMLHGCYVEGCPGKRAAPKTQNAYRIVERPSSLRKNPAALV